MKKLAIQGRVKAVFKVTNTLTAQFEGKGTCIHELATIPLPPLPGPIGLIFGGKIPVGIGFELAGKATLVSAGVTISAESEASLETGIKCPTPSNCEMFGDFNPTGEVKLDVALPDGLNPDAQLRFEVSASSFGFAKLSLGRSSVVHLAGGVLQFIGVTSALSIDAFDFRAGPVFAANLAPVEAQVLSPSYASDYKLSLDFKAGLAQDLSPLTGLIGINLANAQIVLSDILTTSPASTSVSVDRENFLFGDFVRFTVKLNPTTLHFFPSFYNVDSVQIYRKITHPDGSTSVEEVASQIAGEGQTQFDLSWSATESGTSAGNFFAFVSTKSLPLPVIGELELKVATLSSQPQKIAFVSNRDGSLDIHVMDFDGSNQVNLTQGDQANDTSPSWSPDGSKILFRSMSFTSDEDGTQAGISVINADGRNRVDLPRVAFWTARGGDWSPDSSKIAFSRPISSDGIHLLS